MVKPRVIKKYPNRRLYDTVESRYITLADVRRLVVDGIEFTVIDKKTQEDITRPILLQVIAEQEHEGEPMMSQDFLSQIIRSYGGVMQNFVGNYLEESLKALATQQQQMRERTKAGSSPDPFTAMASLAQKNLERWRVLQDDLFRAMTGTPSRAADMERARPSDPEESVADEEPRARNPKQKPKET
jgi:polyhydroxyalkanoate synthesis repressor PhaR